MLTEWQSLPCQLLACPSCSLYLQRNTAHPACVTPSQRHGICGRYGRAAASSWTYPHSQGGKECLQPQKSSECGHFLSFPIYSSAQAPCTRWRVWYLHGQEEFTKEEEKCREMRESTEKSKKKKDGPW